MNRALYLIQNSDAKYVITIFFDSSGGFDNLWWVALFKRLRNLQRPKLILQELQELPSIELVANENISPAIAYADYLIVVIEGNSQKKHGSESCKLLKQWCDKARLTILAEKATHLIDLAFLHPCACCRHMCLFDLKSILQTHVFVAYFVLKTGAAARAWMSSLPLSDVFPGLKTRTRYMSSQLKFSVSSWTEDWVCVYNSGLEPSGPLVSTPLIHSCMFNFSF